MPVHRISVDELLKGGRWVSSRPAKASPTGASLAAVIDARSESEFALDHLPGAINWPSLSDEERHRVGTEYHQISAFDARKQGAVWVARNIARHLEREIGDKTRDWSPLVYCWRGGQRSGALAIVLGQIGFDVHVLDGGYREFRRRVIADLQQAGTGLALRVLCGPTGSGKSRLLGALAAIGEQTIDLEALACHRGSVLGAQPGQAQPSQKSFETQVWSALLACDPIRPVYLESESRMIGRLRVPESLLQAMRAAPCVRIELPTPARVELLMEDYPHYVDDPDALSIRLDSLREVCGHERVQQWQAQLHRGDLRGVVTRLLEEHYDPIYLRSMSRNFSGFARAGVLDLTTPASTSQADTARELARRAEA